MDKNIIHILHLEDNPSDMELIRIFMNDHFPKVKLNQVDNKEDFISELHKKHYLIVLSDFNVPGFQGIEIMETVKQFNPDVLFIFVSGTIGESKAIEVLTSGAFDYVLKDNLEKLEFSVARAIEKIGLSEEKKKMDEEILEYKKYFSLTRELLCIADQNANFKKVNLMFSELLGYSEDELIGTSFLDYVSPNDLEATKKEIKKLMEGEPIQNFTIRYLCKDDSYRWLSWSSTPDYSSKLFYFAARDISEQKENDQKILQAIIKAEEIERQRFSHDLHDGLGQKISAANMYINVLEKHAKETFDEEAFQIFDTCKDLINDATKETRIVSHNIMPRTLKEFGLAHSIREMLSNYKKINETINFKVNFNNNKLVLSEMLELTLYRITQELVNNAIKHAKAKNIVVSIDETSNDLKLIVKDDGIGFNVEDTLALKSGGGIGINNLRQRMQAINGEMKIKSKPLAGTTITLIATIS